ncbi:MAG: LytTR family transcriptional regulator DNA-binding domain-containing protein [Bacteroidetes bacterium]|nr:LytTR family transcriptional regulator DNA-binding domain-containing protein [Bacteroidota bacterium]
MFLRSHKSSIINLLCVKEYSSNEGHNVLMKNGMNVQVSRRKLDDFMAAIDTLSKRI